MGCGPSKTAKAASRRSSNAEEEEFGQTGEEITTVVSEETPSDYPLSPGTKIGEIPRVRSTGSGKSRVGEKTTRPVSGPMKAMIQRTPSQVEFFKHLEEKINNVSAVVSF
ncbi:uncharacterized protein LOC143244902 isoform X3 [Tachypleus tridentatus]|uniref:uncharacterized protein LOC143244902 isoform X3 n=1 Tax=Tachypleus tridentatus TaxID=6853 RepID=UPI003FD403D5